MRENVCFLSALACYNPGGEESSSIEAEVRNLRAEMGVAKEKGGMAGRPMRVYVDTSVFGGVFDVEFEAGSRVFFDRVRAGEFSVVVSSTVSDELHDAPSAVQAFYRELADYIEVAEIDSSCFDLQAAYLAAQIVGPRWEADAMHVAVATVADCRAIVSWNFKHIVNFRRIPLYNGVNMAHGYPAIAIHTPQEMVSYDSEEERL